MTKEKLIEFLEQICACGKVGRICGMLEQMRSILEKSGADEELIELINEYLDCAPELVDFSEQMKAGGHLSERDLQLIKERREMRRIRELEARKYGRC